MSYEFIVAAVKHFIGSDIRYLLTTVHPDALENSDILTGHLRLLNLELSPFGFPEPSKRIDDTSEGLDRKQLLLWSREALLEGLASNELFV